MTFLDCITIFVLGLLAIAVLVSILPSLGMLLTDFFWFATSVLFSYLLLQAFMNMASFMVRMIRLSHYRSKKS